MVSTDIDFSFCYGPGSTENNSNSRQLRMGRESESADNKVRTGRGRPMSAQPKSNLVNCPRQTPTCLVTSDILDSIGNTPLIRLRHVSDETGCEVYAKAEFLNPGGSIKDRIGKAMIESAEKKGLLSKYTVIIEPTSGNTGIALAFVAAA